MEVAAPKRNPRRSNTFVLLAAGVLICAVAAFTVNLGGRHHSVGLFALGWALFLPALALFAFAALKAGAQPSGRTSQSFVVGAAAACLAVGVLFTWPGIQHWSSCERGI